jgi:UDP-N-acetylglucosamine:LPS N-acetylglucosamine transferase
MPMNGSMPEQYFLLYLNTGGGHRAPARAVASFIELRNGCGVKPVLIDGLQEVPWLVRAAIEGGYSLMQMYARWLYALTYFLNKFPPIAWLNAVLVSYFVTPFLERMILEQRPSKIIVFHFLLIRPVMEIVRRRGLGCKVLVVVTDPYTAHPLWFADPQQYFVVFSERLRIDCISRGIPQDHLKVFPFVIDPSFAKPLPEKELCAFRMENKIDSRRSLIVVIGGADGIPDSGILIRQLLHGNPECDIAAVCGRNEAMRAGLHKLKNEMRTEHLKVFGYINFVHALIQSADIVVTKCGASLCMEILSTGKIPVVNSYLWEQERGNVEFLLEKGIGFYEPNPRALSQRIHDLLEDPGQMETIRARINALSLTSGVEPLSEFILGFSSSQEFGKADSQKPSFPAAM